MRRISARVVVGLSIVLFLVGAAGWAIVRREHAGLPPRDDTEKRQLLLLTTLPLVFPEEFSLQGGGSKAFAALETRYKVQLIGTTDAQSLSQARLLLLAHPLAQPSEALVDLDRWVRAGGRVILLADPRLEWPSKHPLGDKLRPPPSFADTGLLAHWGLRLDAPDETGPVQRELDGTHPLLKSEFLLQSEVTGGQTRAQTFLTDARASLEKGQKVPDLDAVRTATSLASSAEQQLALLQKAVQNRIDALDEARKANVPPPPPASSTTAPPPVSNPGLPGEPKSTAGPLTAPPAPAKSEPGLIGVVEAFTSGRYRDAIARAEKLRHLTGRDGAQAALFSAAANYQLFLRGGARDRALHDAARRDAATAKKLDPTLLPDLRMFSPRFAEFYRGVR